MGTSMAGRRRSARAVSPLVDSLDEPPTDDLPRRRYISKIIFTSILGYPVDIGHMEAVNLISSQKYSEKQIVRFPIPSLPFIHRD